MNAHSVIVRTPRDCIPTQEDYDRFRSIAFLHNSAPLFGDQVQEHPPKKALNSPTRQVPAPIRDVPPSQPMTTARANNVAQPYLSTPSVVIRDPVVKKLATRSVTIMELLEIDSPQKVMIGKTELFVEMSLRGPVYKLSKGGFFVSKFEICCLNIPNARRIQAKDLQIFVNLHRDLRNLFLSEIQAKAWQLELSETFLDALLSGDFVKVGRGRKQSLFKITGEKRERRIEYITCLRSCPLRIKFGTSIKLRRLKSGSPVGIPDEDTLLEYLQDTDQHTS